MKRIKCYIIDDESYCIEGLSNYINKISGLELVGSNTDSILAVEQIKTGERPDIVFLDIQMPQLSGLEVAALLPKDIIIIFVTGYMDQAYNAFENNAVDFILKPHTFDRFVKAIQKVERLLQHRNPVVKEIENGKIFIKSGFKNTIEQLSVKDIVNIEACDHYVFIYTLKEKSIVNMRMKELEEILPMVSFMRIHRTHIINIDLIKTIDGNQIHMVNGLNLPLSKSYKNIFAKKIKDRMVKTIRS